MATRLNPAIISVPSMPTDRQPLSAVIVTLNEASRLEACLRSVAFCDEIVVVDSGSSDSTQDLARRLGARVIEEPWRGYGAQKQFAIEQAENDWVLCIDADERVSERLREAIHSVMQTPASHAYRFARCNRFLGRYLRHGEGYPDWSLRLFDRRHGHWSTDPVHEKVLVDDTVATLQGDLIHDSAETLESYFAKQNRYTTLAAQDALARGKSASVPHLLISPALRFFKFYFLRGGFLDGVPGLIHILVGCTNSFAKYAKMLAFSANGHR